MKYIVPSLLTFALTLTTSPALSQSDDAYLKQLIASSEEGTIINVDKSTLSITEKISLNSGHNLGVTLNFSGAKINLKNSYAGFEMGLPGSGLMNANIYTEESFSGNVVSVKSQTIKIRQPKLISNVNFIGKNQQGTAISLSTQNSEEFISFLQVSNVSISGFNFGVKLSTESITEQTFINGNNFSNIIFAGNNAHDIQVSAKGFSGNEISGNNFANVQFQYSNHTQKHIQLVGNAKYNQFSNVMSWDSAGRDKVLFQIDSDYNTLIGYIPTSGNVASFATTTNLLLQTDAGNQTNLLKIGDRKLENSRSQIKIAEFDASQLPILDVRDGEFFVDNNVSDNNRLTNIRQGSDGQSIRIKFSGKTLLSNQWGGVGQFKLRSGSYKPAKDRVVEFTYFGGSWFEQ